MPPRMAPGRRDAEQPPGVTFTGTRDIPIANLTRFPGNARRGDVEEIRASIRRHGQYRAIVVRDTGDALVILAGNHTRDALEAEGHQTARCEVITCTDDEARRINLADNRLAELGTYDDGALAELLSYLDGDYDGTGWTAEDLEELTGAPDGPGGSGDPDAIPEPPAEPVSVLGDLYLLGPHRLLCGDSTVVTDVDRLMNGERAVLMMTDPPYGVSYDAEWRGEMGLNPLGANRAGKVSNDDEADWTGAWAIAPADIAYVWHASAFADVVMISLRNADFQVRQQIIWVKPFGIISRQAYNWQHEPCWYAVRKGATANWQGDHSQTTVWEAASPNVVMGQASDRDDKTDHPTQKPVALWLRAIGNHTEPGDLTYDAFGGSGTAIIAAHQAKRRAFVMELDPAYVDLICERFQRFSGIIPERILEDGSTEPVSFTEPGQSNGQAPSHRTRKGS